MILKRKALTTERMHASGACRLASRLGYTYIAVLGTSMLVSLLAMTSLSVMRTHYRTAADTSDVVTSRQIARSGAELAQLQIRQDPDWRKTYSNQPVLSGVSVGRSLVRARVVDPLDNLLDNHPLDTAQLEVLASTGRALQRFRAVLAPQATPHPALLSGLYAWDDVSINSGATLTVLGAPLSVGHQFRNRGGFVGDLRTKQWILTSPVGWIDGSWRIGIDPVPTPTEDIPQRFSELGADFDSVPNLISDTVLTPGYNPFGPTQHDGVYVVRPTGDLVLKNLRVHGTLVVIMPNGNSQKCIVDENVFFEPARPGHPAIVVKGNLDLRYRSSGEVLSEAEQNTNFNPAGAEYLGQADTDKSDEYPSEIRGLVFVTRNLDWSKNGLVRGAVLCLNETSGAVNIDGHPRIIYDPMIPYQPTPWLTETLKMVVKPGSWEQIVD